MSNFKFSLISDMHVDFPQPKTPYDKLEKFVVVAGDTGNGLVGTKFLNKLKNKGFDVFAIDGNHEGYANVSQGRTYVETEDQFYDLIDQPSFERKLDNDLRIIGTNGWYRVSDEYAWNSHMNDSRNIGIDAKRANFLAEHHAFRIWQALGLHDGPAIVVTHTAPCLDTLNPAYDGQYSNEWYWNPHMLEVIREFHWKILVWCHGHSHAFSDKIVEGVRVVCNPRGYPGENPNWAPKTIEVSW